MIYLTVTGSDIYRASIFLSFRNQNINHCTKGVIYVCLLLVFTHLLLVTPFVKRHWGTRDHIIV